jgi:hypothetical protein
MREMSKSQQKVAAAFHEVAHNEPAIVGKTRKKKGAAPAEKQKVAIALSKARAAGAKIKRKPSGSGVFTDAEVRQGYRHL